tara:strand:+ start:96 stop:1466 length:1371 start_codon:yes stop_codon:yes gene_type:complete
MNGYLSILILIILVSFIVYNFYKDFLIWSNTGSIIEGNTNPNYQQSYIEVTTGKGGTTNTSLTEPECKKYASDNNLAVGSWINNDNPKGCIKTGNQLRFSSGHPSYSCSTTNICIEKVNPVVIPSGFKLVSTGQPLNDITQEECKTFADKINGYGFNVINEAGNPKGCMLQDGTPPGSKGVYYNTGGTGDCGVFGVSKCVAKDTVTQPATQKTKVCKPGCARPLESHGNCKTIKSNNKSLRSCPYECPNPSLNNDLNCKYDQDCKDCGIVLFDSNNLINNNIMKTVLSNKNLIPSDIDITVDRQGNFIRIGKNIMTQLSNIRNIELPTIENDDYESLGRTLTKIKQNNNPNQIKISSDKLLTNINNILSGTRLSNSNVDWSTSKQVSQNKITGMYGDNSNILMGKGDKAIQHHKINKYSSMTGDEIFEREPDGGLCLWKGCEKGKGQPYDSIWSVY